MPFISHEVRAPQPIEEEGTGHPPQGRIRRIHPTAIGNRQLPPGHLRPVLPIPGKGKDVEGFNDIVPLITRQEGVGLAHEFLVQPPIHLDFDDQRHPAVHQGKHIGQERHVLGLRASGARLS